MRLIPINLLAYSAADQRSIFFYLGLIVVLAVVVVMVGLIVRRIFMSPSQEIEAFTLSDIRRLHADGELSDEEYQRLLARSKAAMVNRLSDSKFPDVDRDSAKKKERDEPDKGSSTDPPADPDV